MHVGLSHEIKYINATEGRPLWLRQRIMYGMAIGVLSCSFPHSYSPFPQSFFFLLTISHRVTYIIIGPVCGISLYTRRCWET